jgi:hypothetical protein
MENNLFVSSFSSREMLLNENIENKLISLINLLLAIYILTLNEKTMNYYINIINLLKNTVIKLIIFFIIILNYNIKKNILLILAVILSNHYMYINDYNVLVKNIVKYRSCI